MNMSVKSSWIIYIVHKYVMAVFLHYSMNIGVQATLGTGTEGSILGKALVTSMIHL